MPASSTLTKWLDLITAMTDGQNHTAGDLAAVLGTSVRNFYYTLDVLRASGFVVIHEGRYYHLHPRSPFFQSVASAVDFTENEAVYLHGLLTAVEKDNAMASMLKRKLERYYNLSQYTDVRIQRHVYNNATQLERAMRRKQVVILHGYSSPHSQSVTDRVVEPFAFLGDKNDVRAFEVKSGVNKTFKVARIQSVEIVDAPWFNESKHKEVFTDMFMFAGEEKHRVRLRLDLLARNLMLEEYPHSSSLIAPDGQGRWIFEADLVSYIGISRFIAGLFDHVEVLADRGLVDFLNDKMAKWCPLVLPPGEDAPTDVVTE